MALEGTEYMVVNRETDDMYYLGLPDMRNGGYKHVYLTSEQAMELHKQLEEKLYGGLLVEN